MGGTLQCLGLEQILWFCCRMKHGLGCSVAAVTVWGAHTGSSSDAGHARNYCWVWFSNGLSRDCELGIVSCGLSLVLILSVIVSNSVVLPLLQFCCSKIIKHFFASYRNLKKAMLDFQFVLCYFLVDCRK